MRSGYAIGYSIGYSIGYTSGYAIEGLEHAELLCI